ncbi:MAG: sensor domain-containing diguanylate cyclase [Acidimicrobiales bacterium]
MTMEPEQRKPLISWLEEHRNAMVCALNSTGGSVAMPKSIRLGPDHQVDPRSLLDLVVASDSKAVADAFVVALGRGIGVARVHLSSNPTQAMLLHYIDVREQHGVILRMLVAAGEIQGIYDDHVGPADMQPARPRVGFMIKSEVASILSIDAATALMLGWEPDEMTGHSTLDFIHPDDHVRAIDNWMAHLRSDHDHGPTVQAVRLRYLSKDGIWIWVETSNDFHADEEGSTVVAQLIDVSDEMAATEALRHNERFLRRLTDTVPVGLFQINGDGSVAFVNPVLKAVIGDVRIDSHSDLAKSLSSDSQRLEGAISQVMNNGRDADLDLTIAGNLPRSARVALRAVTDEDRVLGVLGCVVDVTELKSLADTDGLTGLKNRRSIVALLESDLASHCGNVTVIFCDLDGFKQINDRYGHQVGDQLLAAVAERLHAALRPGDHIGRLGGDEFLVFCPGLTDPAAALAVAERLREALCEEFDIQGTLVRIRASMGVACGGPGSTVDDLISSSDAAMYESKQSGGGDSSTIIRRVADDLSETLPDTARLSI